MPKTIDEQLTELDGDEKGVNRALARVEKRRNELYSQLRKIREQRERLKLTKLEGQHVSFKAGALRGSKPEAVAALSSGGKLLKVNRTMAQIEAAGKTWHVPIQMLQDPADGLKAGMFI